MEAIARRADRTAEEEPLLRRDRSVGTNGAARREEHQPPLLVWALDGRGQECATDGRRLDGKERVVGRRVSQTELAIELDLGAGEGERRRAIAGEGDARGAKGRSGEDRLELSVGGSGAHP